MSSFIKRKLISFLQMIIDDIESMEDKENIERLERESKEFKPMSRAARKTFERELKTK